MPIGRGRRSVHLNEDPAGKAPAEGHAAPVHLDEDRPSPPSRRQGADPGSGTKPKLTEPERGPMARINGNNLAFLIWGERGEGKL